MKHTYKLFGMSCNGCKANAEDALGNLKEVTNVVADLKKEEVEIEMTSHLSVEYLQETLLKAGLHYTIEPLGTKGKHSKHQPQPVKEGNGIFYCPMHCEGEKTYDAQVGCSVCGMDLVEQPRLATSTQYTCPMHPEIIKDEMGSCPICGMDLVPMEPT
ncbi:MAG TPA: heavy-metal-associated domain-containing protein, partial [Phaeodactylibacter sp.]|nr:heavy-metal-associated domain-containing protein [Phaeodactylibacter sp.]